jgi:hypothetical protein
VKMSDPVGAAGKAQNTREEEQEDTSNIMS